MTTSPHIDTNGGCKLSRALSPGRVVALVLIGLLVLGLGYLRFGTGDEAVSVPAGAKAGDLILEVERFIADSTSGQSSTEEPSMPR